MNLKLTIFASLAAPALILLVACGGGDDDDNNATAPTPTGSGSLTPVATTPAAVGTTPPTGSTPAAGTGSNPEIAAIISASNNIRTVRALVVIEATGVPAQTMNIDVVNPDKYRITISAGAGGPALEMIQIANDSYIKLGTTWTKQAAAGQVSGLFDFRSIAATIQALQTNGAVKGGTASVGGKTCQLYTATVSGVGQEYCVADNLPVRIVSTSAGIKTTVTFTDYNANITIVPPI